MYNNTQDRQVRTTKKECTDFRKQGPTHVSAVKNFGTGKGAVCEAKIRREQKNREITESNDWDRADERGVRATIIGVDEIPR